MEGLAGFEGEVQHGDQIVVGGFNIVFYCEERKGVIEGGEVGRWLTLVHCKTELYECSLYWWSFHLV